MPEGISSPSSPSTGGSAPPPAAPPAAAPSSSPAPPPAAAPAAAEPVAPSTSDAAASLIPGATEQPSATPKSLDEVKARYQQQKREAFGEAPPPKEPAQPVTPKPPETAAPQQAQPAEPAIEEPVAAASTSQEAEPAVEAPPPPVSLDALDSEDVGDDSDIETILTAEELDRQYPRQLSKKVKAAIAAREAERNDLREQINVLGGKPGMQMAQSLLPLILKEHPTTEDADQFLDQLVLPEHAGAGELFNLISSHFVNTALNDERTGKEFANQIIAENWQNRPDGSPWDLETLDLLVQGVTNGNIDLEVLKMELETVEKPVKSENELRLERENQELRQRDQTREEDGKREQERLKKVYGTQAKRFVSSYIMKPIMPKAIESGWAVKEGETGGQVAEKQMLGSMVSAYINQQLMGDPDAPEPTWAEVKGMIDDQTAFDQNGAPTTRFTIKLDKLQNIARAKFNEIQRTLNGRFKFSSETSHNAKLAEKNGSKKAAPQTTQTTEHHDTSEVPPVAPPPRRDTDQAKTTQEKLDEHIQKFRQNRAAEIRGETVGTL